jgi:hypothetical protein
MQVGMQTFFYGHKQLISADSADGCSDLVWICYFPQIELPPLTNTTSTQLLALALLCGRDMGISSLPPKFQRQCSTAHPAGLPPIPQLELYLNPKTLTFFGEGRIATGQITA